MDLSSCRAFELSSCRAGRAVLAWPCTRWVPGLLRDLEAGAARESHVKHVCIRPTRCAADNSATCSNGPFSPTMLDRAARCGDPRAVSRETMPTDAAPQVSYSGCRPLPREKNRERARAHPEARRLVPHLQGKAAVPRETSRDVSAPGSATRSTGRVEIPDAELADGEDPCSPGDRAVRLNAENRPTA